MTLETIARQVGWARRWTAYRLWSTRAIERQCAAFRAPARFGASLAALVALLAVGGAQAETDADRHAEFEAEGSVLEGPVADYVRKVADRVLLASGATTPDQPKFKFYVLDDESVNAFATKDGYIYVHRGLLAYLDREDQLAAVLGHEIGHVVARHVQKTQRAAKGTSALSQIVAFVTQQRALGDVINMYGAEKMLGYGRERELEADRLGAEWIARAGYDPTAAIETVQILKDQQVFAERFGKAKNATYHAVFSTHPRNDRRLQRAIAEANKYMTEELVEPVDDLMTLLDGITFGNAGAAGAVRANKYFHGKLGFVLEFPDGWDVHDSPAKIIGYDDARAADTFISLELDTPEPGWTPKEFIDKRAKPGAVYEGEALSAGGKFDGYVATLTDVEEPLHAHMIGVVFKGQRAFVFRGQTRVEAGVEVLKEAFPKTLNGLRKIEFADLQEANVEKIKVVEARPGDTYEVLAKGSPLRGDVADQLRLLNGDFPNGQPRAGDLIKIVK